LLHGPLPFSADSATTFANRNLKMTGKIYLSMPNLPMDITSSGKPTGPMDGKTSMILDSNAKAG
jgi:hypothetical protein